MTTMYALNEEDYRCLRENVKELFAATYVDSQLHVKYNGKDEL